MLNSKDYPIGVTIRFNLMGGDPNVLYEAKIIGYSPSGYHARIQHRSGKTAWISAAYEFNTLGII